MDNHVHLSENGNVEDELLSTRNNDKNISIIYKCVIFIVLILIIFLSSIRISSQRISLNKLKLKSNEELDRILVIYVYANTHSLSQSNLDYFIRVGVRQTSNVDYYIILQQLDNTYINENNLPKLPIYAHYIQHENKCFDLGTIGWFISNGTININNYKYFIFLNSSVRGPYLVSYYYQSNRWYEVYTKRLNNYTKLVGSTISCQVHPHVQSYIWVTDQQGLSILLKNGNIFKCYPTQVDTIYGAEIAASQVLFQSGFTIDSLMKKYQGADFRKGGNKDCFHLENPTSDKKVDGISLDPFEVVFIKIKYSTRDFQHVQSRIQAYDKWIL